MSDVICQFLPSDQIHTYIICFHVYFRSSSQNEKRKSDETESYDDNAIYQQVKYFRRSIHEVNALLDLEASEKTPGSESSKSFETDAKDTAKEPDGEANFDSLEHDGHHVYENLEGESLRCDSSRTEDVNKTEEDAVSKVEETKESLERFNVKDLKSRFEEKVGNVEPVVKHNNVVSIVVFVCILNY